MDEIELVLELLKSEFEGRYEYSWEMDTVRKFLNFRIQRRKEMSAFDDLIFQVNLRIDPAVVVAFGPMPRPKFDLADPDFLGKMVEYVEYWLSLLDYQVFWSCLT